MSDCKYGDITCPCQDGDPCHYEGEEPMLLSSNLANKLVDKIESLQSQLAAVESENVSLNDALTNIDSELRFIDNQYVDEDDENLTMDAQLLKYKAKLVAVEKERDEYLEIVNKYEDAQGKGIQTIIEQNIKLEDENLQQAKDWDELDDEVKALTKERNELQKFDEVNSGIIDEWFDKCKAVEKERDLAKEVTKKMSSKDPWPLLFRMRNTNKKLEAENAELKQTQQRSFQELELKIEENAKLKKWKETAKNYRIRLSNCLRKEPKT